MDKQVKSASIIKQEDGRFKAGVLYNDGDGNSETFDYFDEATEYLSSIESGDQALANDRPVNANGSVANDNEAASNNLQGDNEQLKAENEAAEAEQTPEKNPSV